MWVIDSDTANSATSANATVSDDDDVGDDNPSMTTGAESTGNGESNTFASFTDKLTLLVLQIRSE